MRRNQNNDFGSPHTEVCFWLSSKLGETENHIGQQNPNNLFIFAKKPKNQVLKNEKVYQESHWTTKTEKLNFFQWKKQKAKKLT